MTDIIARLQGNALADPWAKPGGDQLQHFASVAPGVRVGMTLNH